MSPSSCLGAALRAYPLTTLSLDDCCMARKSSQIARKSKLNLRACSSRYLWISSLIGSFISSLPRSSRCAVSASSLVSHAFTRASIAIIRIQAVAPILSEPSHVHESELLQACSLFSILNPVCSRPRCATGQMFRRESLSVSPLSVGTCGQPGRGVEWRDNLMAPCYAVNNRRIRRPKGRGAGDPRVGANPACRRTG